MDIATRKEPSLRLLQPLLHLYWRFSRGLTLGVRAAAINRANEVLLVRHTYVPGWHFPGGGVEPGETALDALARELREEALITMTSEPRLHGVYLNRAASERDHVLLYVTRHFEGLDRKRRKLEIADLQLFPLDALPADTTRSTRLRLDEIVNGRPPALLW